jgi:hypothetical protein
MKKIIAENTEPYDILGKVRNGGWSFITGVRAPSVEAAIKYAQTWVYNNSKDCDQYAVAFAGKIIQKFPGRLPLREAASYIFTDEEKKLDEENFPVQYPEKMADSAPVAYIPVSLDQIVDRYLIRYEKESIPTANDMSVAQAPTTPTFAENKKSNLDKLTSFLFEQTPPPPPPEEEEEDPPADDAAADPAADPAADLDLGGDAGPAAPAGDAGGGSDPVVNTPTIDLNDFARSTARLINNFDALLNPQTVILNRAKAYIMSNYDERTAKEFMQILDVNYGLRPVSTEYPEQHENPVTYGTAGISGGG